MNWEPVGNGNEGRGGQRVRRTRGKTWALWLAALSVIAPSGPVGSAANAAQVSRGPYLQSGSSTNIVVRWRTDTFTGSRVCYGTTSSNLNSTVDDPAPTDEHVVRLNGLLPNTKYYYSIGTAEETLASGTNFFVTSPLAAKPTRIWVLGDTRDGGDTAAAVRDAYYAFTGTRHTDLWLMLGDNAGYTGTDTNYQQVVFDLYPEMLRRSVLWPTIGNHETENSYADFPYLHIFTLPTQAEAGGRYYSFDYGNIHFVSLDSLTQDRSSNGPMCTWLEADLAANTNQWLIAFWHHPPYSKGGHDSDSEAEEEEMVQMRENAVPILEAHGVDLVLCGHSHSYERSFLLDGHYGASGTLTSNMVKDARSGRVTETGPYIKPVESRAPHQGTVYVVAGSSSLLGGGDFNHPVMFMGTNELGSLVLEVNGPILDATFVRANGMVLDSFTITKGTNLFRITSFRASTNLVTLSWNTVPGTTYRVEQSPTLSPPAWHAASGQIVATGTRMTWSAVIPSGTRSGFYRVAGQ